MKLIIGLFVCLLVIIIISQPNLLWMLYRLVGILILVRKVKSNEAIIKEQKIRQQDFSRFFIYLQSCKDEGTEI